jgi:hypothetical protein
VVLDWRLRERCCAVVLPRLCCWIWRKRRSKERRNSFCCSPRSCVFPSLFAPMCAMWPILPLSRSERLWFRVLVISHIVQAVAAKIEAEVGEIDLLINNAGIVSGKPFLQLTEDQIKRTFNVNTVRKRRRICFFFFFFVFKKKNLKSLHTSGLCVLFSLE